ncbi:MAG: zinc ribbon domain-containing protein [Anaerolineae bacterium]|nr:zinc ribbon domain-containing protein [Anaerolineae bacterium]
MPIYEYCCQDCHQRFSRRRAMAEADAPIDCAACGSANTRRALSLFSAVSSGRGVIAGSGSSCSSCSASSCAGCSSKS